MKLLHCPNCGDAFRLTAEMRFCSCKANFGLRMDDDKTVQVSNGAVVMGIPDPALQAALNAMPESGRGVIVQTFILPKNCSTVRRVS